MIELKDLTLGYGQHILLDKVSTEIATGQLVALLGRNGTGKSTLLRAVMGLEKPQEGEIRLDGKQVARLKPEELARKISFVTTDKVRIANLSCEDVVSLGRAPYTNWVGRLQEEDRERVTEAMRLVGMSDYAGKTMDKMSDGECQRIMIARALAQDTPVILLDEPTAFLDLPNRYELCLLLKSLAENAQKCIVFSTHDLDIALSLCSTIMLIDNPQLYSLPTSEMVKSGHIERLFRNDSITFDPQEMRVRITETNKIR
ncbi:MAG TPA: ABC transporter ATP-binding protein [Bacteroides reticulotermitis]|nr:ABC transporter ATP-binding protein [Bacteroides reticulotermitis]